MSNKYFAAALLLAIFFFENCSDSHRPAPPEVENQPPISTVKLDTPVVGTGKTDLKKVGTGQGPIEKAIEDPKTTPPTVEKKSTGLPPGHPKIPSGFADIEVLDPTILIDIRYATTNNFTKAKIYDCPKCLLRPAAAEAIVRANSELKKQGFRLKMFDCYRPRAYQQRLWDKVPDPNYVTPPAKGSMHGRGAAVDLTIVDKNGNELEMGTAYDFFGKEAHTDFTGHPKNVEDNRKLLREAMESVGFQGIRTEWWHFSFQGKNYPLSDELWPCK